MLTGKRILLVISGGIRAFKAVDLIRRLRTEGATVTLIGNGPYDAWPVMTKGRIADRLTVRIADHHRVIS